jgi:PAS domain S-box-containing protein
MLQNLRWQAKESATDSAWRWITLSWLAVGIGSVYILAARLSLSLLTPDGVAVFWPAAGVAAGALIAFGPPARWAVVAGTMVATIVANLLGDRNLWREAIEGCVALALLIVMSFIVITLPPEPWTTVVPIALVFPVLLWISARCQPVFAAAAAFIVTLAIVWTTTIGVGHFGDPSLPMADRVFAARAGILAVALCAYVLAALFAERRQHEAALAESEARLQEALTAGAVTTFVWDLVTGSSQRSANAVQILGFDTRQSFTPSNFLSWVHPDDRERFKARVRGVTPTRPAYTVIFRFKHLDGREVWLEETAKAEFDALGRLVRLKGLTLDVTARKRSDDQQRLLIAAFDQRVKNLLARVAGVAKDMRQSSGSLDEYIRALDLRIQSMARVHTLLSQNQWEGIDFAELVRHQLAPDGTDANTIIDGPKVMLTVEATQALAMVLHELVTNAAKYGALSTPHGRVEVEWNRGAGEDAANLLIAWREIGGPAVAALPTCGYGVSIIRNLISQELGGSVDLAFASSGVCCNIRMPLEPARDAAQAIEPTQYSGLVS